MVEHIPRGTIDHVTDRVWTGSRWVKAEELLEAEAITSNTAAEHLFELTAAGNRITLSVQPDPYRLDEDHRVPVLVKFRIEPSPNAISMREIAESAIEALGRALFPSWAEPALHPAHRGLADLHPSSPTSQVRWTRPDLFDDVLVGEGMSWAEPGLLDDDCDGGDQ